MRLCVNGKACNIGMAIQAVIKGQVSGINRQVISRGRRAVEAMGNAEKQVLEGQRSGRVYKIPYTHGKKANRETKKLLREYGHRLQGGQLYRASAPGEAPARRTGNLRMHWNGQIKSENTSGEGVVIIAELESKESYAALLENGTSRIKPRPFVDKIKEKAMPEIQKIYREPYT